MTLLLVSISTVGLWVHLPWVQMGFQWRHSHYEAPYLLVQIGKWEVTIWLWQMMMMVKVAGTWGAPQVWTTVYGKPRRETI